MTYAQPNDTTGTITNYHADCHSGDGGTEGTNDYATPDGSASPITVTGLTNGSHYTCTITATDGTGASDPSPASNSVLVAGLPDAPAAPGVTAASSQVTVTIGTAPADNGSAITGYTANCTSSDGGASGSNSSPGASPSPIVVAPLTNGDHYTCTATATNGIGTGSASSASASVLVSGAPGSPAQPTIVGSNSQVVVTYSAPADNGTTITGYSATCSSSDGGSPGTNSITGATATPITVAPLQNGKHYTCTVTAANGNGPGPTSPASNAILLGVPDAPAQPTVAASNAQIVVTFNAPANNGSAITSYSTTCTDGITPVTTIGPASPLTVAGLTNGHTYTCTVTATNGIGSGAASPASASAMPQRGCARPTGGTHDRGRQRPDRRHLHRTRQQRQHDHRLHRHVHRRHDLARQLEPRRGRDSDHRRRAHQRPHVHVHRHRDQRCRYRTGLDTLGVSAARAPERSGPTDDRSGQRADGRDVHDGCRQRHPDHRLHRHVHRRRHAGNRLDHRCNCGADHGHRSHQRPQLHLHGHRHQRHRHRTSVAGFRLGPRPRTPAAAPQPSALATSGQIVVTFTAPANNGSAITGYTAICTDGVSPATNSITGAAAAPITITGLTNGHSYTCTVTASNAIGAGLPSPASAAVAVGAPAAPAVSSVVATNGQIVVTFTAPADNGNVITGYGATCTDGVTPASALLAGAAAAPITVTGLTNGHSYTCTVTATNGNGAGPASVASAAAVPTAGAPAQPAPPTITTGNAQIVVNYTAPADNGSPITFYSATCTSADGGTSGLTSITGPTATPITVTGLTNGHTYTCVVSAINAVGSSPSSAASASAFVGLPSAPPQPTVAAGNAQIVVTFAAPNNNGSTITGYTATCTSGNGGVTGSTTGTASPLIVTALTNGASYTCTVAAANVFGPGPSSPASAAAVPSLVPASPAAPTVLFGNERVTVTFTPIVDVANPVTGYAATCTSLDGGTPGAKSGTTSPLVVTSLTNGKTYTCTVTATNIVGTSPPSPPSAGVVPAAAPAAPTLVSVTAGNAALTVSFSPNSNNGSAIIAFTATCTSANGGITGAASGPTSPLTVSQLNNGNIYVCKVAATNAVGASVPSATSQAFIVGQPAAPSILPVVSGPAPGLTGSLKVSFHPGAANAGAIMQYRATCIPVGSGVTRSNIGSSSPIIVSNVLSGHAYSCSVDRDQLHRHQRSFRLEERDGRYTRTAQRARRVEARARHRAAVLATGLERPPDHRLPGPLHLQQRRRAE